MDVKTVAYIMNSYKGCETIITFGKSLVPGIKMARGVKQGDPLSPILFNLVIDELLDNLPGDLGVTIEESRCNSLAFADDLKRVRQFQGWL